MSLFNFFLNHFSFPIFLNMKLLLLTIHTYVKEMSIFFTTSRKRLFCNFHKQKLYFWCIFFLILNISLYEINFVVQNHFQGQIVPPPDSVPSGLARRKIQGLKSSYNAPKMLIQFFLFGALFKKEAHTKKIYIF